MFKLIDGFIIKSAENKNSSSNLLNTITGSNQEKGQKDMDNRR